MPQQVGAHGYVMEFPVAGFEELENRDWHVIITRPDGTSFERFAADDDVAIVDLSGKIMGVRIKSGDWTVGGTYQLQLWDETDSSSSLRSSVIDFVVLNSLTPPEP